jgi:hypothetical protein
MLYSFLSGAVMSQLLVASAFFFRFWKKTRDRLFAAFGFSFALMAIERTVTGLTDPIHETTPAAYIFRLAAFICIMAAIIDKNRKGRD